MFTNRKPDIRRKRSEGWRFFLFNIVDKKHFHRLWMVRFRFSLGKSVWKIFCLRWFVGIGLVAKAHLSCDVKSIVVWWVITWWGINYPDGVCHLIEFSMTMCEHMRESGMFWLRIFWLTITSNCFSFVIHFELLLISNNYW